MRRNRILAWPSCARSQVSEKRAGYGSKEGSCLPLGPGSKGRCSSCTRPFIPNRTAAMDARSALCHTPRPDVVRALSSFVLLGLLTLVAFALSVTFGDQALSWSQVLADPQGVDAAIFFSLRV